jgi:hypothetical protein
VASLALVGFALIIFGRIPPYISGINCGNVWRLIYEEQIYLLIIGLEDSWKQTLDSRPLHIHCEPTVQDNANLV